LLSLGVTESLVETQRLFGLGIRRFYRPLTPVRGEMVSGVTDQTCQL
jgi:hypothetical protein